MSNKIIQPHKRQIKLKISDQTSQLVNQFKFQIGTQIDNQVKVKIANRINNQVRRHIWAYVK